MLDMAARKLSILRHYCTELGILRDIDIALYLYDSVSAEFAIELSDPLRDRKLAYIVYYDVLNRTAHTVFTYSYHINPYEYMRIIMLCCDGDTPEFKESCFDDVSQEARDELNRIYDLQFYSDSNPDPADIRIEDLMEGWLDMYDPSRCPNGHKTKPAV